MTSKHILLYRLAEKMLEQQKNLLSVDDLFDDVVIADFVKSIQIDSPYQQMLLEGVLTESVLNEKLYVSFTVEGYFHFVLGEVIDQKSKDLGAGALQKLIENNTLNGIHEGVEQCLIRDVDNGNIDRITGLIDAGGESEKIARYPLAHAFLKNQVDLIFQALMANPSINDWNTLKQVRGILISQQKQETVNQLDVIIKESEQLKTTINGLLSDQNEIKYNELLNLISFYTDFNSLDQAKIYYTQLIEKAEKTKNQDVLVLALEQFGDSEYKRSGQDGYKAAMDAFTRALEIRESESILQKDKLKNTYRLLGFAYLSLGLQVIKSTEYFEKAKSIMLQESSESAELADINLYIGLVNFWRGLRSVGRWGHADSSLLEGLSVDLFEYADSQFNLAYSYFNKNKGKSHPQTLRAIHYLQENRYSMGDYEKAIPWLKKYVETIPFKTKEHTDNYYFYSLIVSLEEQAKMVSSKNPGDAIKLIDEAISYAKNYDEGNLISQRLFELRKQIETGRLQSDQVTKIEALPELTANYNLTGAWRSWSYSDALKGFHTNNWMEAQNGIWFFNVEKKQLAFWNSELDTIEYFNPEDWPEGCGRFVYDNSSNCIYSWSSITSNVYRLNGTENKWKRISFGVHDVRACGASFGFDPVNKRLYEFGGYGYFTYKNWLWVYDIENANWIQIKENKPGISPYPRNGQLLPIENGNKAILISGIGSDTGIQREHKARLGLGSATDVGYFTWLRDAHELDMKTMEWKPILEANNDSIRHEGAMAYIKSLDLVINWGGIIPSAIFGEEPIKTVALSGWELHNKNGFQNLQFNDDIKPENGGYFFNKPNSNQLLYKVEEQFYVLEISSKV